MSQKSNRPPASVAPLPESEWNFDAVPGDELEACYYYECSREFYRRSATLQRLHKASESFHNWWLTNKDNKPRPKIPGKHMLGLLADEYTNRILSARTGFAMPIDFRTFPALAWQASPPSAPAGGTSVRRVKASAADRQESIRRHSNPLHIETLAQLERANLQRLPDWIHYHWSYRPSENRSTTEFGFFAINWDASPTEIAREFSAWLKRQISDRPRRPRAVSRGGYRDKLKRLGALRVRRHYRHRELVDHADTNLKVAAPYSHYPDLLKATKQAERELAKLFPLEQAAARIAASPLTEKKLLRPMTVEDIPSLGGW